MSTAGYLTVPSYVASNNATDVNFDLPDNVSTQNQDIVLQITNQYGCVFTSAVISTDIKQAVFDGSVNPSTGDYCEGSVPLLNFVPSNSLATPPVRYHLDA